ncbi:MAG: PilZ domain-containing protein [Syntrophaceae bacterium]|nr:PilZ domain-containing protein [Syntrophaceae bacterium]
MEKESPTNRREYSRVYAYIPLSFRKVLPEERPVVRARLAGDTILPGGGVVVPEIGDRILYEWLKMLNGKLDSIIRVLTIHAEGFQYLHPKAVQISGSGMSFSSAEPFDSGDLVELKMILTVNQPTALFAYGEVIKVEKQTSGYIAAVSFVKMDDHIRDEIVRFVFEREREILREKRLTE